MSSGENAHLAEDARSIFRAGLSGVKPDYLLERVSLDGLPGQPLEAFDRVVVVGGGKASMVMAGALENRIGEHIDAGLVIVPHGYPETFPEDVESPETIEVVTGGHPLPDRAGVRATRRLLELAEGARSNDLVIALISGGGSALLPAFAGDISLEDGRRLYELLLESGADIHEMNTIRRHCSKIAGGQLARAVFPATLQTFVLSDVVGDDLSVIASGPTVPDPTTFSEALAVVRRCGLEEQLPQAIETYLERGLQDPSLETPDEEDPIFEQVNTLLLGSNRNALKAARKAALERNYRTEIVAGEVTGEAREVGRQIAKYALEANVKGPTCLLWGGETTVTVRGEGKGDRNQELVLAGAITIDKQSRPMVILSGGTDGIDGPTDAAGAWATPETAHRGRKRGMVAERYLANNNSYAFFAGLDSHVKTGPTHTNVMDIQIVLLDVS
jgi:hydroxypyruvate reductase